jgi:hypothetical protein
MVVDLFGRFAFARVVLEATRDLSNLGLRLDAVILVEGAVPTALLCKWRSTSWMFMEGQVPDYSSGIIEPGAGPYAESIRCIDHLVLTHSDLDGMLSWLFWIDKKTISPVASTRELIMPFDNVESIAIGTGHLPKPTGYGLDKLFFPGGIEKCSTPAECPRQIQKHTHA